MADARPIRDAQFLAAGFRLRTMGAPPFLTRSWLSQRNHQVGQRLSEAAPTTQTKTTSPGGNNCPEPREKFPIHETAVVRLVDDQAIG
jgi:hypothetical protein